MRMCFMPTDHERRMCGSKTRETKAWESNIQMRAYKSGQHPHQRFQEKGHLTLETDTCKEVIQSAIHLAFRVKQRECLTRILSPLDSNNKKSLVIRYPLSCHTRLPFISLQTPRRGMREMRASCLLDRTNECNSCHVRARVNQEVKEKSRRSQREMLVEKAHSWQWMSVFFLSLEVLGK